jgi:hypothetical protein
MRSDKKINVLLFSILIACIIFSGCRVALDTKAFTYEEDANRLPNGNILITGTRHLFEITPDRELVWLLVLTNVTFRSPREAPALGFYKAERITP